LKATLLSTEKIIVLSDVRFYLPQRLDEVKVAKLNLWLLPCVLLYYTWEFTVFVAFFVFSMCI
jgi:hypothetical protein